MSGHETIRVLEVEVDAPPCPKDKATASSGERDTANRPLQASEDPQVDDPSWRTVILATNDRRWNGWKDTDGSAPSSGPDGKSEGKGKEEVPRPAVHPEVGDTQDSLAVSQSTGGEGKSWPC